MPERHYLCALANDSLQVQIYPDPKLSSKLLNNPDIYFETRECLLHLRC